MAAYTTTQLFLFFSLQCLIYVACQAVNEQPFVLSFITNKQFQEMVESGEHFLVNFAFWCMWFSPLFQTGSAQIDSLDAAKAMMPLAPMVLYPRDFRATVGTHTQVILVNFGTVGCIRCKDLEPHYQAVFDHYRGNPGIGVFKANDINLVRKLGLNKVPAVMLYRHGVPILYEGEAKADEIISWVEENMESFTVNLKDEDFEHLTQSSTGSTTGDWLVKFCDPDDHKCITLQPIWESIAYQLKGQVNVASVDTSVNPKLVKRFKIETEKEETDIIFFHNGKQYTYTIAQKDSAVLIKFATKGYKHAQGIDVMPPPSPFDELTETIALQIKTLTSGASSSLLLLVAGGTFGVIFFVVLFCLCCRKGGIIEEMGKTKKSV